MGGKNKIINIGKLIIKNKIKRDYNKGELLGFNIGVIEVCKIVEQGYLFTTIAPNELIPLIGKSNKELNKIFPFVVNINNEIWENKMIYDNLSTLYEAYDEYLDRITNIFWQVLMFILGCVVTTLVNKI